ncbi:MAG: hypothetical protein OQL08_11800 [Gammaproteobacteria bacterium]|nr:hypothetical protein [Gammaproteobacteria bacterium]
MKTRLLAPWLLLPLLLGGVVGGAAHADSDWGGNVNLLLGGKSLDDGDWLAHQQGEAGILLDFGRRDWPLHIAVDLLRSRGDFDGLVYYLPSTTLYHVEEEVTTRELNFGVRHYFDTASTMRPYIGGGMALVSLESDWRIDSGAWQHDKGEGTGIWLNGGILWGFGAFNLGFDVRLSVADVEMDLGTYKGGGGHTGLLLGYHW